MDCHGVWKRQACDCDEIEPESAGPGVQPGKGRSREGAAGEQGPSPGVQGEQEVTGMPGVAHKSNKRGARSAVAITQVGGMGYVIGIKTGGNLGDTFGEAMK